MKVFHPLNNHAGHDFNLLRLSCLVFHVPPSLIYTSVYLTIPYSASASIDIISLLVFILSILLHEPATDAWGNFHIKVSGCFSCLSYDLVLLRVLP